MDMNDKTKEVRKLELRLIKIQMQLRDARTYLAKSIKAQFKLNDNVLEVKDDLFGEKQFQVVFKDIKEPITIYIEGEHLIIKLGMPGIIDPTFNVRWNIDEFNAFVEIAKRIASSGKE